MPKQHCIFLPLYIHIYLSPMTVWYPACGIDWPDLTEFPSE